MFSPGATELIVIAVIILLLFGAKRIPEIGKGLGGALREFRNVKKELSDSKKENITADQGKLIEEEKPAEEKQQPSLEKRVAKKVLEQVPGVKKAMYINEKVKKVKEVIK